MSKSYWITGVVIVAILAGGIFLMKKNNPVQMPGASVSGEKTKGPANAPIEILEYSDFQCPACRNAEPGLAKIMADYPGQIKLVFRHFPLSAHRWAGIAHQSAECANSMGRFWEFHDRLYAEQPLWSNMPNPSEAFLEYARDLGLNVDQFAACLADPSISQKIMAERAEGEKLQLDSTPTFFFNKSTRVVGGVELMNAGVAFIRKTLGLPPLPPVAPPPAPSVSQALAAAAPAKEPSK